MTTPRDRAIYFAKQAFALMQMRGLSAGLIRLDTEDGARWSFTHDESGYIVILKHAANHAHGGAVDAKRTQLANIERMLSASRARREAAAKAEEPAPVDPAIKESGPVGPDWQDMGPDCAFFAQAQDTADGKPGLFAFGPTEDAARRALAARLAEEPAPVDPAAGLDMGVELITEARPVRIAGGVAESGMAEEPKPGPAVTTIDATPTWRGILPALVALVENGTFDGRKVALAELSRMADIADSAVAAAKAAPVAWRTGSDITLNAERADNWRAMGATVYPLFDAART